MIRITDKSKCCGCTACVHTCATGCIKMVADAEGFHYPQVDEGKCIDCSLCEKVCPVMNRSATGHIQKVYALKNQNERVQMRSSSGGVFYALAKSFLARGIVYAAAFNESFVLEHRAVKDENDLENFIGSKYVQSDLKNSFAEIKEHLKSGREVLFVGTPCQVAGMKDYLKEDYKGLVTADFICHGVPSPKVFEKYKAFISNNKSLRCISFRDKTHGWENYSMKFTFDDGSNQTIGKNEDLFLKGFFDNLFLRPSCYHCAFKSENKYSDFTLGDFWGIKEIDAAFYDAGGVSSLLINSQKGMAFFEEIAQTFHLKEVDFEDISRTNSALLNSANPSNMRRYFFKNFDKKPIEKLLKESLNPGLKTRIELKLFK